MHLMDEMVQTAKTAYLNNEAPTIGDFVDNLDDA
jgi:hypothetical protein